MNWNDREEQEILGEMRRTKFSNLTYGLLNRRLVLMGIMAMFILASFYGSAGIESNTKFWFFPATWECKNCGYDNYEGIDYCGLCGERKS